MLAETLPHNSSLDHYPPAIQRVKELKENNLQNFLSDNSEHCNYQFSLFSDFTRRKQHFLVLSESPGLLIINRLDCGRPKQYLPQGVCVRNTLHFIDV